VFTFHVWNSAKWVAPFCVSKVAGRDVGDERLSPRAQHTDNFTFSINYNKPLIWCIYSSHYKNNEAKNFADIKAEHYTDSVLYRAPRTI
jgi:hypothetical protein